MDIEFVVDTEAGHKVGTAARIAERTVADHRLSGMAVAAESIVQAVAYSRAVLFVLALPACQADCHNWYRSAHLERFSVHNWYKRHSPARRLLLAGSVRSCYRKHCWRVLLPGRRGSDGLRVVPV